MLQVKDLCVEIGGKMVVNGASFAVMPRDKVGLVGRNGAGKTTLFKVLGGANEPKSGTINRKGGFGYLPQDPRIAGSFDARTAISHILSGRGIDEDIVRMEKLRIAMEETASDSNVAKFTRAEEQFLLKGGYAADSEGRAIAAGLGLKPDRLSLALGVLSGGERRRVELARILFSGSDT
ncbi:MAG: ATP-binding cassette domain-containing protein, partial [Actinobacteria bacterium]|nr:ATP-binding cassette domain-containing protein [Actinomycetota bacterium]